MRASANYVRYVFDRRRGQLKAKCQGSAARDECLRASIPCPVSRPVLPCFVDNVESDRLIGHHGKARHQRGRSKQPALFFLLRQLIALGDKDRKPAASGRPYPESRSNSSHRVPLIVSAKMGCPLWADGNWGVLSVYFKPRSTRGRLIGTSPG